MYSESSGGHQFLAIEPNRTFIY